ncbi:MAG: hypothetical protein ABIR66_13385 [Saprospiraceae bacterium]
MKYLISSLCFCLILGCQRTAITIYVHYESKFGAAYRYEIAVDGEKLIKDSILFSTTVPNFNTHSVAKTDGVLRLSIDTLTSQIQIRKEVSYYSFFILSDTALGSRKIKIIVKAHEKKPRFY